MIDGRKRICLFAAVLAVSITSLLYRAKPSLKGRFARRAEQQECNPFRQPGIAHVDDQIPSENYFVPIDTACPRSSIASRAIHVAQQDDDADVPEDLHWLLDRTVVLFGDSHERYHLEAVCDFFGKAARHTIVTPDHQWSPPPYSSDVEPHNAGIDHEASRPHVCHIDRYNLTLISIHSFGVDTLQGYKDQTVGSFFVDKHYYSPITSEDKIDAILLPLLHLMGRTEPDLIEYAAGYWDLLHLSMLEDTAHPGMGEHTANLPLDYVRYYEAGLHRVLDKLASAFPDPATPILFRHLHMVQTRHNTPKNRVAGFTTVGRKVVNDLADQPLAWGTAQGRMRHDEWGPILLGQEDYIFDAMHYVNPVHYLWCDILLWELRRAATGRGE
ncbi:uncharacterized protein L969DRAFT_555215 [Mixia osmundae IAM 14324]|uniref:Uncharacterized protein n=1 Tax=Mixia osmundae (strain CBS 9802 / IAM 14324 / JCM 22182 / KY 12970) TaxID=764103 RepID=G7DSN7_MIXOS|nr:uncharacterized protein L969DRAFT_555215 [Mixia osmundae IAM 14324]KEI37906.1 hypothetical protein L969DRAFT_555215 [Mixia osmundae IAM 14324]GAA93597.1 hypothetical protein E5Q_00241 [Mixia osmundae IAM 14324]